MPLSLLTDHPFAAAAAATVPPSPSVPLCCEFHQSKRRLAAAAAAAADGKADPAAHAASHFLSPAGGGPAFHSQACLRTWKYLCSCILRLGKMLLYGLQGQQESERGEPLYEREGALFDALWELLLRFLVPVASETAR